MTPRISIFSRAIAALTLITFIAGCTQTKENAARCEIDCSPSPATGEAVKPFSENADIWLT